MSVYKVPQDVEAEDTLVGPFTLKQFIFLIVSAISGYLTFVLAAINPLLIILTLPFVIIFAILGFWRKPDQPIEVYIASAMRFYFKPRKRLWSQDGIMETVEITVPPKQEHLYTDGRSKAQVTSQLRGLASMMDTRGWSVKNASLQAPPAMLQTSDRLVGLSELPNITQPTEVHAGDDILDPGFNKLASNMNQLAQNAAPAARQSAITQMQGYIQPQQPANQTIPQVSISPQGQMQTVQPTPVQVAAKTPDIVRLSQNEDLNLSTIARQADQAGQELQNNTEISLR